MHQPSPAVERAVAGAAAWAARSQSVVKFSHYILALLDEEEGRPALLLERLGLSVPAIREQLQSLETQVAPEVTRLYTAARAWSLAYRHDPEFLTDAFFLAVVGAHPAFQAQADSLGFGLAKLERLLTNSPAVAEEPAAAFASFQLPDATAEIDAARVLDANFNRAREAVRVLEDYCRFALDDRFLSAQLKELRHGLATAAQRLPFHTLLASRETLRDVGTATTGAGEYTRVSPQHVAVVNAKRLQESLRSLEEFAKVFGEEFGRDLEALRYRAYTLERAILQGTTSRERLKHATLYVLLTRSQCVASLDWTLREAARGGADIFQLREKTLPDRELIQVARNVRQWTRETGTLFIMNDRPDIARLCEADGVHLGQDDLTVKDARRILGAESLIGVSTHNLEQLRQAVLDGADYIGVGPTFPSQTKAFETFAGLDFVRAANAESSLPAFALGGISLQNVEQVVAQGARRIAVSSAIATAEEPEQIARLLKAALSS